MSSFLMFPAEPSFCSLVLFNLPPLGRGWGWVGGVGSFSCGLELGALRCAWEGDDVANVLHARDEEYEALEAQAEAGVRA